MRTHILEGIPGRRISGITGAFETLLADRRRARSLASESLYAWLALAGVGLLALRLWRPARRAIMGRTVRNIMVRDVVTVDPSAPITIAAQRMRDANVGALPVITDDGTLRGVITDRDLVVRALADGADPRSLTVGQCATRALTCARPDWDVDRAMRVMSECQIGRLPVVDDADRLVGIVTLSSLAYRAREDDEAFDTARDVSRRSARAAA